MDLPCLVYTIHYVIYINTYYCACFGLCTNSDFIACCFVCVQHYKQAL